MTSDHNNSELYHHGVKGQRWGVRRYQNKDGSLTPAGERRQAKLDARRQADDLKAKRAKRKLDEKKAKQDMKEDRLDRESARRIAAKNAKVGRDAAKAEIRSKSRGDDLYDLPDDGGERIESAKVGKALAIGALAVVGVTVAAYAYKKFKIDSKKAKEASEATVDKLKSDILKPDKDNPGSYLLNKLSKDSSQNSVDRLKKLREQSAQNKAAVEAAAKNKYTANTIARLKKLREQGAAKKAAEAAAEEKYTTNMINRLKKLREDHPHMLKDMREVSPTNNARTTHKVSSATSNAKSLLTSISRNRQQKKFETTFAPVFTKERLREKRYTKLFDEAEAKQRAASGQQLVNSLSALLQTKVSTQSASTNSSAGSVSSKAKAGATVTLSVLEALKNRKAP